MRLLEQKPHLGGRARSFQARRHGLAVDNGQHLLMGCYHATIRFLERIGTLDRVRFQKRLAVHFLDREGRSTALECPGLPSPWHLLLGVLRPRSFSYKEKWEVLRLGRSLQWSNAREPGTEKLSVREWLTRRGQSERLQHNFWDLLCIAALNEDPAVAGAALFERVLRLALFTSSEDSRLGVPGVGLSEMYVDAAAAVIAARGGQVECGRSVSGLLLREGSCRGVRLADGTEIEAEMRVERRAVLSTGRLVARRPAAPGTLLCGRGFLTPGADYIHQPLVRPGHHRLELAGLRGTTVQWLFNKGKTLGSDEHYVSRC